MKITLRLWGFFIFLLTLSGIVSASAYLDILRELDIRVLCLLVWLAPLIALLLIAVGGIRLVISENLSRRKGAKSMIYNSVLGLVIAFSFIFLAAFIANLDLTRCLGELGEFPDGPLSSTTTSTSTISPECGKFSDCEECIDNNCAWCYEFSICLSKDECKGKCFWEHEDNIYEGWCIGLKGEVHCPKRKITGELYEGCE